VPQGAAKPAPETPPKSEDVSTIMYTSGTTGDPKGVVITHGSIIAALGGLEPQLDALCNNGDYYLSYLPLAHIFERVVVNAVLYKGGGIGFYQGDPRLLIDDILALRPSFFVGVPRVFDRIYDKIRSTIDHAGPLTKFLFHTAYEAKKLAIKQGGSTPIWDALVFRKFKSRLGGRVKAIISGSAPLTAPVHEFLLVCFGCPVIQGIFKTTDISSILLLVSYFLFLVSCLSPFSTCN
jgi:long-chain acyl-CoA synthetase